MMENRQFSIWEVRSNIERNKWFDEKDETKDQQRRSRGAYACSKCCCCPCSSPILIGFLIGALVASIGLATALSIYLVDSRKTTGMIQSITNTFTTVTPSTVTTSTLTSSTSSSSTSVSTSTTSVTSSTVSTTTSVTTTTTTTTTTTAPYCTTRVTFDDIPGQSPTSGVIPNGYNNLNWTNGFYLNTSAAPFSGFQITAVSPPYVGYNPGGSTVRITTANGTRFAFNSIIVNSAWRDNLTWTITLARGGVNVISAPFLLQPVNRTTISCSTCTNMDTITMSTSGGYPRSDMSQNGTEFSFDDLCISFGY